MDGFSPILEPFKVSLRMVILLNSCGAAEFSTQRLIGNIDNSMHSKGV